MRKISGVGLTLVAAMLLTACGQNDQPTSAGSGSPTTPTAPTAPPASPTTETPAPPAPQVCAYVIAMDPVDFEPAGGDAKLTISAAAGCKWTIKSDATWLAVEGPTQGEGAATLKLEAEPNEEPLERRATLTVADKSQAVSQRRASTDNCTFQVSPVAVTIPKSQWTGDIDIAAGRGCQWTATSDAPWMRLRNAGGTGPGKLTYEADFNPETGYAVTRGALIAIRWNTPTAGQNVRITQWGNCNVALGAPPEGAPGFSGYPGGSLSVGPDGGKFHLFVLTDPFRGCAWTVESNDTWVSVEFPRLHQVQGGDGDLHFTVPANPSSSSRRAVLLVGDRPLTITQQGR